MCLLRSTFIHNYLICRKGNIMNLPFFSKGPCAFRVYVLPRRSIMIWKVLHNRLATEDVLQHLCFNLAYLCRFCNANSERLQHIFLDCPCARFEGKTILRKTSKAFVWGAMKEANGLNSGCKDNSIEDLIILYSLSTSGWLRNIYYIAPVY